MVMLFESGSMKPGSSSDTDFPVPTPIRVETALSRFPVHRLAKHGDIAIDIRDAGASIRWEVTYNNKYGQPGPLAYKLDTLLINRKIEEAGQPIPRIIRLGSLRDIYDQISPGQTGNTTAIKNALHQNASAYIDAKICYQQRDGRRQTLETAFHRYDIVFTGETLPDGRKADAVYVILSDIFMQVINSAKVRPLDYDYLKSLPPASQRFYELLSFQMFAVLKNKRGRAKLTYSELCTYAPLVRQYDWNVVRPQLARIHAPHREHGYIADVEFEATVDPAGRPDWFMLYKPGPKARADYRAFNKKHGLPADEDGDEPADSEPVASLPAPDATLISSPLAQELVNRGVTPAVADELVRDYDAEKIRQQLEVLDWHDSTKPGKITEPAAWLVTAIKNGHDVPKKFVSRADRERKIEATRKAEQERNEKAQRKRRQEAADRKEQADVRAYWNALTPKQQEELQTAADASATPEELAQQTGTFKPWGQRLRREEYIRQLLKSRDQVSAEA